jgi:hypothetical protein
MITATYDVHGAGIRVEAEEEALAWPFEDLLGAFRKNNRSIRTRATGRGGGDFLMQLTHGDPVIPDAASVPIIWQGVLPAGEPFVVHAAPGRRILELTGYAMADVDIPGGRARFVVRPRSQGPLTDGCILPALCEALTRADHHIVHAATLIIQRGRQRRAIILSGQSGAGKTTTALALAAAGMEYLTDDMSFITPASGRKGLRVWGLPNRLKVLAPTLSLLPWIERFKRGPGRLAGEYSLDCRAVAPDAPRHTAAPGAVCFLDPRNNTEHRIEPMDKVSAIARLARENVRAYETDASGPAGHAFAAMAALLREAPAYRLSLCPRLETLYDVISSLVDR